MSSSVVQLKDIFFSVYNYFLVKKYLEKENTTFRLLLGEEPSIKSYQVTNPETVDPNFPQKYLKKDRSISTNYITIWGKYVIFIL